jgi:hypothetical protein
LFKVTDFHVHKNSRDTHDRLAPSAFAHKLWAPRGTTQVNMYGPTVKSDVTPDERLQVRLRNARAMHEALEGTGKMQDSMTGKEVSVAELLLQAENLDTNAPAAPNGPGDGPPAPRAKSCPDWSGSGRGGGTPTRSEMTARAAGGCGCGSLKGGPAKGPAKAAFKLFGPRQGALNSKGAGGNTQVGGAGGGGGAGAPGSPTRDGVKTSPVQSPPRRLGGAKTDASQKALAQFDGFLNQTAAETREQQAATAHAKAIEAAALDEEAAAHLEKQRNNLSTDAKVPTYPCTHSTTIIRLNLPSSRRPPRMCRSSRSRACAAKVAWAMSWSRPRTPTTRAGSLGACETC